MSSIARAVCHLIFNWHCRVSKEIKTNLFIKTTTLIENKTANGLSLKVRSRFKFSVLVRLNLKFKSWKTSNKYRQIHIIGISTLEYVNQLWQKALVYVLYWQVRQNTVLFGSSLIIKPGPLFVNWLSQCYLSLDHTRALKNSTIGKIENW